MGLKIVHEHTNPRKSKKLEVGDHFMADGAMYVFTQWESEARYNAVDIQTGHQVMFHEDALNNSINDLENDDSCVKIEEMRVVVLSTNK